MSQYDIYLLCGTVLILIGCVALFSATVDGRSSPTAIILLVLGFGCLYGASTQSNNGMELSDIPTAIGKLIKTIVR